MYAAKRNMSVLPYCINDLAGFALFDAYIALRQSPLYKREIKYKANLAMKAYKRYEQTLFAELPDQKRIQIYLDMADEYQSYMQPYIDKLWLAVLSVLTKIQHPDRLVLSHVAVAQCMLATSATWFNEYFDLQRQKYGVDLRKDYRFANLEDIREKWKYVTEHLFTEDVEKKIGESHDFRLAAEIICNKGQDRDALNKCAQFAFDKNGLDPDEVAKEFEFNKTQKL